MEQRILGKTGRPASIVGLGTWQLGADWGSVTESDALAVLRAAVESGVTFFDTADVYGDGRSERIIGRFLADNAGQGIVVATKMGRRVAQVPENYTLANFRAWTDRSRVNLGVDRLDLVQLHCPPTPVYYSDAVYDALDTLVAEERIAAYGVSVETCERRWPRSRGPAWPPCRSSSTLSAVSHLTRCCPRRRRPGWASSSGCRWRLGCCRAGTRSTPSSPPTTTGATTGMARRSTSARRSPEWTTRPACGQPPSSPPSRRKRMPSPRDAGGAATTAQAALRWVTQQPGVTTVIPGARNPEQARQNAAAAALPPLSEHALAQIEELYDKYFRAEIHSRW